MSKDSQYVELSVSQQIRIYSPLFFILGTIIAMSIFIGENLLIDFADFGRLCTAATILCLLGFFFTGTLSSPELKKLRKVASGKEVIARGLQLYPQDMKNMSIPELPQAILSAMEFSAKVDAATEILSAYDVETPPEDIDSEKNLTVPELLGTGGVYGIVLGLGIFEALGKYVERTTAGMVNYFNNTAINQTIGNFSNSTNMTLSIAPILQSNLPEALRLSGFLFTLIPFVHGTMLMFSKKWYHDTEYKPHYFVALIYFIVVFIITIMYLFIAVNIMDSAFFLYSLWILTAFNSVWLVVHSKILKSKLKKQFLIHREWIFLDLNTLAFLSVFLFASPNLLSINQFVESDSAINFLISLILFSRALTGYIISWNEFYQPAIIPTKPSTN